jgi:hypothetical protein
MCRRSAGAEKAEVKEEVKGASVAAEEMKLKQRYPQTPGPTPSPSRKGCSLALQCRHGRSSKAVACPLRTRVTATRPMCGSPQLQLSIGQRHLFQGKCKSARTPALTPSTCEPPIRRSRRAGSWLGAVESYSPVRGAGRGISLDSAVARPARGSP